MDVKTVEYSAKNIKNILSKPINIKYLKSQKPSSYDYSYGTLLELFECLMKQQDKKKWLIGGASLVYSWMPRALTFYTDQEECALSSLCEIHKHKDKYFDQDDESIIKQLNALKDFIDHSLVGTSKLLHFSYPTVFPIWDSVVKKAFSKEPKTRKPTKTTTKTNNSDIRDYIEYARSVHEICKNDKQLVKSLDHIELLKGKTCVRKVEYALFLIGRRYKEQEDDKKNNN